MILNADQDIGSFDHHPHAFLDREPELRTDLTDVDPSPILERRRALHARSVGVPNTSFHVPAAAHTYRNR